MFAHVSWTDCQESAGGNRFNCAINMNQNLKWQYEAGQGRYKHRWSNDYAGFEPGLKGPVGKCPCSINKHIAEEILNTGIPYYGSSLNDDQTPAKIYAVYQGVVYEAVPTSPGISYHGYPWRGDLAGRPTLPKYILRQLQQQAQKTGCEKEYSAWMKKYSN